MPKKLKVDESTPNPKVIEIMNELEQLHTTVMRVLNEKDILIAKQEELLEIRQSLNTAYDKHIEALTDYHQKKFNNLCYLSIFILVMLVTSLMIIVNQI